MKTTRSSKFTLLCLLLQSTLSFGFAPVVVVPRFKFNNPTRTQLFMAGLPDGYQEFGTQAIVKAGEQCGATQGQLQIDWKAGSIIVTVLGDSYVSATDDEDDNVESDDEEEQEFDEEGDNEVLDDDQAEQDKDLDDDEDMEETQSQEVLTRGVDVTQLAKAINLILDDGGMGLAIAEVHSIQVTTPGSSDELEGIMFTAYKGFDVIVQFMDSKSKKLKTVDGRLVERNEDFTVINIKGRMKNLKNDNVMSVKLPKAKKEKGGR